LSLAITANDQTETEALAPRRQPMLSIEVLRGFAALAVVFYHTYMILLLPEYGGIRVFETLASRGWLGVNFFFVLSGFIIFYAHRADVGHREALPRYAWRRVVRIYPMYWIALSLYVMGAMIGIGHPDFAMNPLNIAWSYTLVGLVDPLSLPLRVAWTLFHEVQFYLFFALLLVSKRVGTIALAAWFTAILLANVFNWHATFYLLHMWNVYFLVGLLVNFAIPKLRGWHGVVALVVGVAGVVWLASGMASTLEQAREHPVTLFALAVMFALVIIGAIVCERRFAWKPPKLLLLLGSASYSIYLFHSPVVSLLAQINAIVGVGRIPPLLLFATMSVVATAVGIGVHLLVEKPLLRFLRRFERHSPRLTRSAPVPARAD
jgi:exopolysaccharide production protein ExoZ